MGIKVTTLDPQPAPKQLTVKNASLTLEDHFLSFLSKNNKTGFTTEEPAVFDENNIGDILVLVAQSKVITGEELQACALKIHRLTPKSLKLGHVYEILAILLGYNTTAAMAASRVITGPGKKDWTIENKRDPNMINMKVFDDTFISDLIKHKRERQARNQPKGNDNG